MERQKDLNRFIDKAHLVIEADIQRESMCVFEINLVSQSSTDLGRSGGWVQMETQSTAITQVHRHIYMLRGLGSLSAGRRKVRMKFFKLRKQHNMTDSRFFFPYSKCDQENTVEKSCRENKPS